MKKVLLCVSLLISLTACRKSERLTESTPQGIAHSVEWELNSALSKAIITDTAIDWESCDYGVKYTKGRKTDLTSIECMVQLQKYPEVQFAIKYTEDIAEIKPYEIENKLLGYYMEQQLEVVLGEVQREMLANELPMSGIKISVLQNHYSIQQQKVLQQFYEEDLFSKIDGNTFEYFNDCFFNESEDVKIYFRVETNEILTEEQVEKVKELLIQVEQSFEEISENVIIDNYLLIENEGASNIRILR